MSKTFGILAEFSDPTALMAAAKAVHDAGYDKFDVYSPFPIHGMDTAMGLARSKVPYIVLVGGTFGLLFGLWLQTWVATSAYRLVISGKPFFSYQAFIPVTFELMILCSAFAAVFGMFATIGLPEWHHPLLNEPSFKKVTSHGFFLAIESSDKKFNSDSVKTLLTSLGGTEIKEVSAS